MKFLHEFLTHRDGTKQDNGYWEIRGNRLVNAAGGWHDYHPTFEDEILESDWETVRKLNFLQSFRENENSETGWIAPDGTFYGTDWMNHWMVAEYFDTTESDLEDMGFVKIYLNPLWPTSGNRYEYIYTTDHITQAQVDTLEKKGFTV